MKNEKFKNLIIDAYNLFEKGSLVGILYGAVSTYGFSDIKDINNFVKNSNPDMLYLKSTLVDAEVDIYEWELEYYTIIESEKTLYIKLKNKKEISLKY